jgi:hypothetical protein
MADSRVARVTLMDNAAAFYKNFGVSRYEGPLHGTNRPFAFLVMVMTTEPTSLKAIV